MAYKIKKQHNIIEDIELLAEDNSVSMTIHVDINPDAIAKDYRHIQLELIHAQKAVNNKSNDAFEQFEKAVISMFNLIFGEKNICVVNRCDPKRIISRRDMIRYRN